MTALLENINVSWSAEALRSEGMVHSVHDLDAKWLGKLLSSDGRDAKIDGMDLQEIGMGLMGSTYRVLLNYASDPGDLPRSLVFKMTGEGPISRRLGRIGYGLEGKPGFYGGEVRFYAQVLPHIEITAPKLYASWISDDEEEFSLLLADIDDANAGDELTGCTFEQARDAVINVAGLHAPFWNSPILEQPGWLQRPRHDWADTLQESISRAHKRFHERQASVCTPEQVAIVDKFVPLYAQWFLAENENMALTHNDYRLDNLLFRPDGSSVAVDWQSFTTAHSGRDLGLFLGCSVPIEIRRHHLDELLEAYRLKMVELGVSDYTLSDVYRDFRLGLFLGIQNVIIGMNAVTLTERGHKMFMHKLELCTAAISDLNALEALEDL